MAEIREGSYKSPYISRGKYKGNIRNPAVAYEALHTLRESAKATGAKTDDEQVAYYKLVSWNEAHKVELDDPHIRQASETVKERQARREQEERSKLDTLTGLSGKVAYEQYINDALGELQRNGEYGIGVIRLDLDYFGWVNDFLGGHQFGDIYLASVADLIQKVLREKVDIGFRPGGDEFAVLLKRLPSYLVFQNIGERLQESLSSEILAHTIGKVLESRREISSFDGKYEREGTVALRQMLTGLRSLNTEPEVKKHFLEHARGSDGLKNTFLQGLGRIFNEINEGDQLNSYLDDNRVFRELNGEEKINRREIEATIAQKITGLLWFLGVSSGGVYLTRDNKTDFKQVDDRVDTMVGKIKKSGGGSMNLQEWDNSIPAK